MFLIDDIINGIFGKSNTESTNNSNAAIARSNNKFNERMFYAANEFNRSEREATQAWNAAQVDKQNAWNAAQVDKQNAWNAAQVDKQNQWNLDMWNRQNQYNSPEAQRQRMVAAGLNPYLSGISTGSAQSSPQSGAASGSAALGSAASSSPASSAAPPRASEVFNQTPPPLQLNAGGFLDLANFESNNKVNEASSRFTNAKAEEQEISNQSAAARFAEELQGMILRNKGTKLGNRMQQMQNYVFDKTKQYQIDNAFWSAQQSEQQFNLNDLQQQAMCINLDYLPAEKKLNLAYQGQMLSNAIQQGMLTKAQAYYQWSAALNVQADTEGKKISNKIARETFNDVVLGVRYDTDTKHNTAKKSSWDAGVSKNTFFNPLVRNFSDGIFGSFWSNYNYFSGRTAKEYNRKH